MHKSCFVSVTIFLSGFQGFGFTLTRTASICVSGKVPTHHAEFFSRQALLRLCFFPPMDIFLGVLRSLASTNEQFSEISSRTKFF